MITIHKPAFPINCKYPIGITIKGKTKFSAALANGFLQWGQVGAAAAHIDCIAIGAAMELNYFSAKAAKQFAAAGGG